MRRGYGGQVEFVGKTFASVANNKSLVDSSGSYTSCQASSLTFRAGELIQNFAAESEKE